MMNLLQKLRKILGLTTRAPDEAALQSGVTKTKPTIIINTKTPSTMSMFNYGVGGNEVKVDANEAIQEIQENKTLLVAQLTKDEPVNPEIITGLKSVEEVFKFFRPGISVDHETPDGQVIKEDLRFATLADFTPKNITQQSPYLKNMHLQQEQFNKIVRQLKTNKVLKTMLEDEQSRAAFIDALKAVAQELNDNQ